MKDNLAVLVDVDKTLLIDEEGSLNLELIAAFKKAGVSDIYLFTSMSLKDIVAKLANPKVTSRPDLIEKLAEHGINVLAVLTPADVAYKQGIGKAYEDLYAPQYARLEDGTLTEKNYTADKAFVAARERYSELHEDVRSAITDKTQTDKSLLFEYFVTNKPDKIDSILVVDDDQKHLDAIQALNNNHSALTVKTIKVDEDNDEDYFLGELKKYTRKKMPSFFSRVKASFCKDKREVSATTTGLSNK